MRRNQYITAQVSDPRLDRPYSHHRLNPNLLAFFLSPPLQRPPGRRHYDSISRQIASLLDYIPPKHLGGDYPSF